MSTTPENSVQTVTRYAWNGVQVAYAGALAASVMGDQTRYREYDESTRRMVIEEELRCAEEIGEKAAEIRQAIDAALKITLDDEDNYVASAVWIEAELLALRRSYYSWGDKGSRTLKENNAKIMKWACEMWLVWRDISKVRKIQARHKEDMEMLAAGLKTEEQIRSEHFQENVDKFFSYFWRSFATLIVLGVIGLVVFSVLAVVFSGLATQDWFIDSFWIR